MGEWYSTEAFDISESSFKNNPDEPDPCCGMPRWTLAKALSRILTVSVFPAPDSPETKMD